MAQNALLRLPEKYRIPLYLFYYEGQSTGQIAEALGLSVSGVTTRLAHGREKLKADLEGEFERVLGSYNLEYEHLGETVTMVITQAGSWVTSWRGRPSRASSAFCTRPTRNLKAPASSSLHASPRKGFFPAGLWFFSRRLP